MLRLSIATFIAAGLLSACDSTETQIGKPSDHADYAVIGKSVNTRQEPSGNQHLLNTVFFAEIFQTKEAVDAGGKVKNVVLTGAGIAKDGIKFSDEMTPYLTGARTETVEELDKLFPDSTYYFNFETPDGDIKNMPATFKRENGESLNPGPIEIYLHQNGLPADANNINPDIDLVISWSPFEKGGSDPKGIRDDMIYAMMGNCMGMEVAHSGHAFDEGSLTYVENEFTIPSSVLHAGQPFMVEVEHSNMETDIFEGMEIIVTYAASTFLDIKTTGENTENLNCPDIPYAFDGGANDRKPAP